jgi:hypothetical protein
MRVLTSDYDAADGDISGWKKQIRLTLNESAVSHKVGAIAGCDGRSLMPVSLLCPQLADPSLRLQLFMAARDAIRKWRPGFEKWQLTLFRSQSGEGWDLAISGPRFRRILTLNGPLDDLPGLVTAYVDAVLSNA